MKRASAFLAPATARATAPAAPAAPAARARAFAPAVAGACLLAAALAPADALAQATDGAVTGQLVRLVIGLGVIVAVLFAAGKLLPRLGGGTLIGSDRLRVVASLAVGQRERVVVVQVGDSQVMLGVAPGRVELLERLEKPLAAKEPAPRS